MAVRFQLRRDTAANWASANSVLALGEPGVETDTLKVKVGDGSTAWNSLGYSITKDFADLTNTPTTLAAYGITDALSLAQLSVTQNSASGTGALSYNNATGVFEYTPPDFAGLTGNFTGSVFADDSTVMVDGVSATINLANNTTTDLAEGTNLYYTDGRADARIALQVGANLDLSSKSTTDLAEGTNEYYTSAKADARIAAASITDLSDADQTVQTTDDVTFNSVTGNVITSQIDSSDSSAIEIQTDVTMLAGLTVGNHIVPSSSENIDLGSASARFRDLYLSGNSAIIGDLALKRHTGGGLLVSDHSTGDPTNITTHNVTANDVTAAGNVDVTGNLTMTGYIAGPATFTIDPAAVGDNTGTVVIAGDLQVDGTTTTINSTTLEVDDKNITLSAGSPNSAGSDGAGIRVDNGSDTDATLLYDGVNDAWHINKNLGLNYDNPQTNIHIVGTSGSPNVGVTLQSHDTANATATLTLMARDASNVNQTVNIQNTLGRLNIDANMDVIGVGTNFKSASYNILNLQTDTDDNGSSDDGIFKITNGSAGTTKAEFRWDESEDLVHVSYGDHGRHISINSSGNVGIGTGSASPSATLEVVGTAKADTLEVTENVTAKDYILNAIDTDISETAIDVIVYDTRLDTDGGAWRQKTKGTSWYNEGSGTNRGSRKEFPQVAVIVCTTSTVTIYDADDPDMPMWMKFIQGSYYFLAPGRNVTSAAMLNGILCFGQDDTSPGAVARLDFISDTARHYSGAASEYRDWNVGISERNASGGADRITTNSDYAIVDDDVKSISMVIEPNASYDSNDLLPAPTIAFGCGNGISIVRSDGSIVNSTNNSDTYPVTAITITADKKLYALQGTSNEGFIFYDNYEKIEDVSGLGTYANSDTFFYSSYNVVANETNKATLRGAGADANYRDALPQAVASPQALNLLDFNYDDIHNAMVDYVRQDYTTGWMPGDTVIALAADDNVVTGMNNILYESDFSTNTTGWTADQASITTVSDSNSTQDALQITPNASVNGCARYTLTTVAGTSYTVSLDVVSDAGPYARIMVGTSDDIDSADKYNLSGTASSNTNVGPGHHEVHFTATGTTTYLSLEVGGGTGQVTTFNNIRVYDGNLWGDTTLFGFDRITAHTYVAGQTYFTIDNDMASSPTDGYVQVNLGPVTEAGKIYMVEFEVDTAFTGTEGYVNFCQPGNAGSVVYKSANHGTTSKQKIMFPATGTNDTLAIYSNVDAVIKISNCALWEVTELNRVHETRTAGVGSNVQPSLGFVVKGDVNKELVATGTDIVAYSNFDRSNYLVESGSSLLQHTSDWSYMLWYYHVPDSTRSQYIVYDAPYGNGSPKIEIAANSDDTMTLYTPYGYMAIATGFTMNLKSDAWNHIVMSVKGGTLSGYLNGELQGSVTLNNTDFTNVDRQLTLGGRTTGPEANFVHGKLALFRATQYAPSTKQIKKIYNDEREMFMPNAQSLLGGTSEDVQAISYDPVTNILHVGTSSGRSEFNRLTRINYVTGGITDSISAVNGLVAQE